MRLRYFGLDPAAFSYYVTLGLGASSLEYWPESFMSWLIQLFSRRRLYKDLSEEIQEHLEEKIEELVAGGMSRKEAAAAARRAFGNVTLTEENSRNVWRWPSVEELL